MSKVPSRGFTLIELLVVILILSLLAGGVSISLERISRQSLNATNKQAQLWLAALSSRATLLNQTYGIVVRPDALAVLRWESGRWLEESAERSFKLPENIIFEFGSDPSALKDGKAPFLILMNTGERTGNTRLWLSDGEQQQLVDVNYVAE